MDWIHIRVDQIHLLKNYLIGFGSDHIPDHQNTNPYFLGTDTKTYTM